MHTPLRVAECFLSARQHGQRQGMQGSRTSKQAARCVLKRGLYSLSHSRHEKLHDAMLIVGLFGCRHNDAGSNLHNLQNPCMRSIAGTACTVLRSCPAGGNSEFPSDKTRRVKMLLSYWSVGPLGNARYFDSNAEQRQILAACGQQLWSVLLAHSNLPSGHETCLNKPVRFGTVLCRHMKR